MRPSSLLCALLWILLIFVPFTLPAEELDEADSLLAAGGLEDLEKALQLYKKVADGAPGRYEAQWKCARAHYLYADAALKSGVENWKAICAQFGKAGFRYGEKAIAIEPDRVEGNLYYGLAVWKYSDGVSILTALREGLKGSTQNAFERAYAIDKRYDNGFAIKALGRFWFVLPWPLRDYPDSIRYLEEHHRLFPEDPESLVWIAETLIALDKEDRAKRLLKKAAGGGDPYYATMARDLLARHF